MTGGRKQVRGDRLVDRVLRTTLAEIGRVGIEHLSIEEVAVRAHVNKTTIYRRWPAPVDLARAALSCAAGVSDTPPDTGTLLEDLRAFADQFRSVARLPAMKTVMRLRWSGAAKGPLAAITRGIQEKKHAEWKRMLRRAVARGELPPGTDIDLVHDVLVGSLIYLVVLSPRRSDAGRLSRAIELVLEGALHAPHQRRARPRSRSKRAAT